MEVLSYLKLFQRAEHVTEPTGALLGEDLRGIHGTESHLGSALNGLGELGVNCGSNRRITRNLAELEELLLHQVEIGRREVVGNNVKGGIGGS